MKAAAPARRLARQWLGVGLVAAAALASAPLPAQQAATSRPGVKRALLVGINNYKALPALRGALNDVEMIRQVLVGRWGFEPAVGRVSMPVPQLEAP